MNGTPAELQLDHQLCFALYAASRAVTRAYTPLLEPLGLTYPQYIAMLVLWEGDDLPVKALGERLGLDSATLTPLLKRLEERGWVDRTRDAKDQRVVRIRLTAKGRALQDEVRGIPAAIACAAGFDPKDADSLRRLGELRDELRALADRAEGS